MINDDSKIKIHIESKQFVGVTILAPPLWIADRWVPIRIPRCEKQSEVPVESLHMDPLSDESEEILGENGPPVYSGTFWGKGKSWMCEAARWWFQASTASLTVGKLDLFVWSPLWFSSEGILLRGCSNLWFRIHTAPGRKIKEWCPCKRGSQVWHHGSLMQIPSRFLQKSHHSAHG